MLFVSFPHLKLGFPKFYRLQQKYEMSSVYLVHFPTRPSVFKHKVSVYLKSTLLLVNLWKMISFNRGARIRYLPFSHTDQVASSNESSLTDHLKVFDTKMPWRCRRPWHRVHKTLPAVVSCKVQPAQNGNLQKWEKGNCAGFRRHV